MRKYNPYCEFTCFQYVSRYVDVGLCKGFSIYSTHCLLNVFHSDVYGLNSINLKIYLLHFSYTPFNLSYMVRDVFLLVSSCKDFPVSFGTLFTTLAAVSQDLTPNKLSISLHYVDANRYIYSRSSLIKTKIWFFNH